MVLVWVLVRVRVWVCVSMGHLRKRRRRREPLVRLRAGRPHCVFPPPLNRLGSRKRLVVIRPIRVRRRRNRHIALTRRPDPLSSAPHSHPYPHPHPYWWQSGPRCCSGCSRAASSPQTRWHAPPRVWPPLLRPRGASRWCQRRPHGPPIARPVLIRSVIYLIRLIGWVIKRTDRIPVPSPVRLVRRGCALALLAFCRGALDHDEALLALALVPLECARDGMEPVGALLVCTHGRERVLGRSDLDAVRHARARRTRSTASSAS